MNGPATCPRCGAMLTSGGCLSCGYPSLRLDSKVGADTNGGGVEFVKFPVLMSALELNATLTARLEEMKAAYETSHASRMHAEDAARRLEAERDDARREFEELIEWRRATSLDELVYGTGSMHEVVDLRVEMDRMHTELAEAEDAIRRLRSMYCARVDDVQDDPAADESEKSAYLGALAVINALPAVRRASERRSAS